MMLMKKVVDVVDVVERCVTWLRSKLTELLGCPPPPPTADNGPLKKAESLKTHCGVNKMLVHHHGCESS
jgi:hypothetical protein